MNTLKIISPWTLPVSKKKNFSPNINAYRNSHHYTLSKAKRVYSECVREQLNKDFKQFEKAKVMLVAYPPTKRIVDLDNLIIHCKFTMDALVQEGVLEDDNYNYLIEVTIKFGSIDKENPRVEIFLEEVTNE